eukprot:GHVH01013704.1.p1 GENE.GHVH01013704.1~~GHVH01013704.1.p1  ORF type:complete len:119 (-),score=6.42 GHVH01013704.1:913-1269(-)
MTHAHLPGTWLGIAEYRDYWQQGSNDVNPNFSDVIVLFAKFIHEILRRIAKYFWWPKIAQSVSTYIEHCMFCSRNAVPVANNLRSTLSRPSHSYVGPIFFNGENHHYSVIDHATRFVV